MLGHSLRDPCSQAQATFAALFEATRKDRCAVEMRVHGAITNNREVSAQAVAKPSDVVWRRADLHQPAGAWLATKTAN
jgi:hypothetical protein